jgi:hypothetical protein
MQCLNHLTQLKQLRLELTVDKDVATGTQWEMFLSKRLRGLVTFQFIFKLDDADRLYDVDLESFRSAFWLNHKRWFVVINDFQASDAGE